MIMWSVKNDLSHQIFYKKDKEHGTKQNVWSLGSETSKYTYESKIFIQLNNQTHKHMREKYTAQYFLSRQ